MELFTYLTPAIYFLLVVVWTYILIFYLKKIIYNNLNDKLLKTLLIILAIDAFRTFFESSYFGLWFTSLAGIFPIGIYDFLAQPEVVFFPKMLNLFASALILFILIRKWIPSETSRLENIKTIVQKQTEELQQNISHLTLIGEKFKESESKYRTLFESVPIGLTVADKNGTITESNKMAETLLGLSEEEQKKRKIDGTEWRIIRPDGSPFPQEDYASVKALKENRLVENVEMGIVKNNEKITWINVSAVPFTFSNLGVLVAYHDITDRKKADEERRVSDERFLIAQNMSPDGFTIFKPVRNTQNQIIDFTWVYQNPAAAKMNGTYPQDVVGRSFLELFPGQKDTKFWNAYVQVAETSEPMTFEDAYVGESMKSKVWFRIVVVPTGENIAILAQDITARKLAEENVIAANFELEKTELNARIGGWSIDVKTMTPYLSKGVREIYEIAPDQFLPVEEGIKYYIPEHRPLIEKAVQECIQSGTPYELELELITAKGNKRWVRTGGSAEIENDSIVKITGFLHDITKLKVSEIELQSAYQQLQANEQQLRASYQQLEASEQQLRASNHQLVAHEKELILAKERAEKSEERLRLVVKGSNDAPWDWDLIENELYYSPQWWHQLGYEPNELKPNTDLWESLMCPDDKEQVDSIFGNALKTGLESYAVEFRLLHKEGYYVPVLSRGFITYDENKKPIRVSGTNLDLSAQKKAEQDLKKAKEKAEESEARIKSQNQEVLFNNERLESLLKVSQFQTDSVQELLDFALTQGVELTRSKIGYIYFYSEEKKQFILNTWSKEVMKECSVMNPQTVYDLDKTGCWGEAVRQRKPIIINDYPAKNTLKKGTPEGHVKLEKFLTIPVIFDNKIVAVAGVANKSTDYDNSDVRQLTLLMDSVWKMSERLVLIKDFQTAKEKAEENENKLITLLGNLPGLVYSSNSKWETDFINGALHISGYTDEDFLTNRINWINLIHEDDRQMVFEQAAILQKKKTSMIQEYRIIAKNNKVKHVSDYKTSVFSIDNKFVGVEGVVFDVSEKTKQKEELVLAKEKAEESDRLKSAFLANMSHEIRTPMNGILGFTSLLQEPDLSEETKEQYIEIIQKSGDRMLNTVNDIIEISRIEAGLAEVRKSVINVSAVMKNLMDFFQHQAQQKGLLLSYESEKDGLLINTDLGKFESILTNLIKNAIKFTNKGKVDVSLGVKDGFVQFCVKDTGIGVPQNRINAIFNRFEKADIEDTGVFQGSGLGLAIAKSYVEILGGTIWIESVEGEGSTFCFTLPYLSETIKSDLNNSNKSAEKIDRHINQPKILIVEDDKVSADLLRIMLKSIATTIIMADSGNKAVEFCKIHSDIDIVLMDIKLPGIDGFEATRRIREFNKEVIIIAQSAYALSGNKEKGIAAGCNDYITKPVKQAELIKIITKQLSLNKGKHGKGN